MALVDVCALDQELWGRFSIPGILSHPREISQSPQTLFSTLRVPISGRFTIVIVRMMVEEKKVPG